MENALKKATKNSKAVTCIIKILKILSGGASYGLPVGGPAARLLSEILLNRNDRLLQSRGIRFCRFVDDYCLFSNNKEEAYSQLIYLCSLLLENEGLTLQKSKTRILTGLEFWQESPYHESDSPESPDEISRHSFLRLHLHFDPYSDTAVEDYEALKGQLAQFDIIGMLSMEMQKTRISESITRKLVKAIKLLPPVSQDQAIRSLVENFPVLYPIFPTVLMSIRDVLPDLDKTTRELVFYTIRRLISTSSFICSVPVNMAYAIRILSYDKSEESDTILINVYDKTQSIMIKKDIIIILAQHDADYWISTMIKHYNSVTQWEKRALLIASYILEDEGSHWRDKIKQTLSTFDKLVMYWASKTKQSRTSLDI